MNEAKTFETPVDFVEIFKDKLSNAEPLTQKEAEQAALFLGLRRLN